MMVPSFDDVNIALYSALNTSYKVSILVANVGSVECLSYQHKMSVIQPECSFTVCTSLPQSKSQYRNWPSECENLTISR